MAHRLRAAHLALLLVVLTAALAVTSGLVGGVDAQQTPPTETQPADQTTLLIELRSDGDARWTVTTTFDVTNEREQESFNTTAERFVDGEGDTLGFSAFERARADASNATGRSMALTDVERRSDRGNTSLSLSFTWTNFARSEGETRHVDDVYNTTEPWLTGLESDQTLILELPPGAGIRSGPPKQVLDGQIVWEGPTTFDRSELELVYNPGAGESPNSPSTSVTGPGEDPDGDGSTPLWAGLVLVSVVVAASGVYVLFLRDRDGFGGDQPVTAGGSDGDEPPAAGFDGHLPVTPLPNRGGNEVGIAEEVGDEGRPRVIVQRRRRPRLDDLPLPHHRHSVGHAQRALLIVGDIEERRPDLTLYPAELGPHLPPELPVERRERFV